MNLFLISRGSQARWADFWVSVSLLKLYVKLLHVCVYTYIILEKRASFHQIFKKVCDIKTN